MIIILRLFKEYSDFIPEHVSQLAFRKLCSLLADKTQKATQNLAIKIIGSFFNHKSAANLVKEVDVVTILKHFKVISSDTSQKEMYCIHDSSLSTHIILCCSVIGSYYNTSRQ